LYGRIKDTIDAVEILWLSIIEHAHVVDAHIPVRIMRNGDITAP
jgi:hypothetical protein